MPEDSHTTSRPPVELRFGGLPRGFAGLKDAVDRVAPSMSKAWLTQLQRLAAKPGYVPDADMYWSAVDTDPAELHRCSTRSEEHWAPGHRPGAQRKPPVRSKPFAVVLWVLYELLSGWGHSARAVDRELGVSLLDRCRSGFLPRIVPNAKLLSGIVELEIWAGTPGYILRLFFERLVVQRLDTDTAGCILQTLRYRKGLFIPDVAKALLARFPTWTNRGGNVMTIATLERWLYAMEANLLAIKDEVVEFLLQLYGAPGDALKGAIFVSEGSSAHQPAIWSSTMERELEMAIKFDVTPNLQQFDSGKVRNSAPSTDDAAEIKHEKGFAALFSYCQARPGPDAKHSGAGVSPSETTVALLAWHARNCFLRIQSRAVDPAVLGSRAKQFLRWAVRMLTEYLPQHVDDFINLPAVRAALASRRSGQPDSEMGTLFISICNEEARALRRSAPPEAQSPKRDPNGSVRSLDVFSAPNGRWEILRRLEKYLATIDPHGAGAVVRRQGAIAEATAFVLFLYFPCIARLLHMRISHMKKVDGFWHFDFPGCNGRRYTPLIGRAPVVLNPVLDVYAKTRDEIEARTGTKCDSFFLNTVGSKWRPDDFCSMLSRVACRVIGHRINVIQSSTIILDSLRADKWTEPDIALVFGVEQSIIDRRSKREQERRRDVELGERRDEHRALNQ